MGLNMSLPVCQFNQLSKNRAMNLTQFLKLRVTPCKILIMWLANAVKLRVTPYKILIKWLANAVINCVDK